MIEVGKRYKVSFQDCCAQGGFEATLVLVDQDDDNIYDAYFDNGVKISGHGVSYQEVDYPE